MTPLSEPQLVEFVWLLQTSGLKDEIESYLKVQHRAIEESFYNPENKYSGVLERREWTKLLKTYNKIVDRYSSEERTKTTL